MDVLVVGEGASGGLIFSLFFILVSYIWGFWFGLQFFFFFFKIVLGFDFVLVS